MFKEFKEDIDKFSNKDHENTNRERMGEKEDESGSGRRWGRGAYNNNILQNFQIFNKIFFTNCIYYQRVAGYCQGMCTTITLGLSCLVSHCDHSYLGLIYTICIFR